MTTKTPLEELIKRIEEKFANDIQRYWMDGNITRIQANYVVGCFHIALKTFLKDYALVKKGDISDMLARSGWEMLPAVKFPKVYQQFYDKGAKDMEAVWKEIIKEVLGVLGGGEG